ncbi:Uncharacterized protein C8034_v011734 [Colletotrichum sidae]|uniref:LysM domain-containing protein n=1 Tax=Colletotrichum sidae TaxID=1347389 RepID=A0A4R8TIS4_9PEZI|nr:Uncharacterized protein C8034_v011734 [Colletotrichum sidae]
MSYYGNNNGGYGGQQGGYPHGGPHGGPQGGPPGGNFQQGGYQQGGYQQGPGGEANSYYNDGRQQHQQGYGQPPHHQQQQNFSPPPYQNQDSYNNHGNPGYRNDGPGGYGGPGGEDGERGLTGALVGGAAGAFGGNKIGGNFGHGKLSTVLGGVAGAFAGHKMQDGVSDWKHKRDEEKEEEKHKHDRPQEHHGHNSRPHSRHDDKPRSGGNWAGGFTGSSQDIRLDAHGDFNLHASCKRRDGSWQQSTISLNRILSNDQGSFRWHNGGGGGGGGQSSYTVQQGDTLRNIAGRFNTSWEEVARHNNIANPDQIWPGQNLNIPNGGGNSGGGGNFGASARDVRLTDGGQRLEAELLRDGRWIRSSIILDERIGNNDGTLTLV